jgi:arginine/lysine/ornithine decarboxylase
MSDLYNIVAIATVGDEKDWYNKLVESLLKVALSVNYRRSTSADDVDKISIENIPIEQAILPWEAINREKEYVSIENALGRICAEMVIPYPPGIPVIMPGEIITQRALDYVFKCIEKGIKINGTSDALLKKMTVIK